MLTPIQLICIQFLLRCNEENELLEDRRQKDLITMDSKLSIKFIESYHK